MDRTDFLRERSRPAEAPVLTPAQARLLPLDTPRSTPECLAHTALGLWLRRAPCARVSEISRSPHASVPFSCRGERALIDQ
jgi:hypothetical protein